MSYKSINNGYATLAVALGNNPATDTTLQVTAGKGDLVCPVIAAPDHTYLTLENSSGQIENVKVTDRAAGSDVMTVVRAQDGTTIQSWLIGDIVECRPCAAAIADLQAEMASLDTASMNAHTGASDPHPQYALDADLSSALATKQAADPQLDTLAAMTAQQAADLASISAFVGTLMNDADAATARATLGAGTVTGVTASGPITSTGGAAPNIAIPAASASADGYMSAAYASKLDGIQAGAIAGVSKDQNYANVGSYCFCRYSSGATLAPGSTLPGSALEAGAVGDDINGIYGGRYYAGTLPGTWRAVSGGGSSSGNSTYALFQRIA